MADTRILRVFPRRNHATPTDDLAVVGPPGLFPPKVDEIHVSVTFTWDIAEAEMLARAWSAIAPTKIGGPALGDRGGDFVPGRYLAPGYLMTSRGCPNRCRHCLVPGREGDLREIPIGVGYNVLDSNLLACSDAHIQKVFEVAASQRDERGRKIPAQFTGGLEAALFKDWHADLLAAIKPQPTIWFAFDHLNRWQPLVAAVEKLKARSVSVAGHRVRAYVLIGFDGECFSGCCQYPQDVVVPSTTRAGDSACRPPFSSRKQSKTPLQNLIVRRAEQCMRG